MTRKPILLGKNACCLLLIFTRYDEIFDSVAGAYDDLDLKRIYPEAAKELIRQLKGYHSISFMEALIEELKQEIKDMR